MDHRWQQAPTAPFLGQVPVDPFAQQIGLYNNPAPAPNHPGQQHFEQQDAPSGASDYDASLDIDEWPWSNFEIDYDAKPLSGPASSGDERNSQTAPNDNDQSDISRKRREQNRRAQKAFRQRKQEEVEVLRDRLAETEERFSLLQNLHHELIDAYEDLLSRYQNCVGDTSDAASAAGKANEESQSPQSSANSKPASALQHSIPSSIPPSLQPSLQSSLQSSLQPTRIQERKHSR